MVLLPCWGLMPDDLFTISAVKKVSLAKLEFFTRLRNT